MAIYELGEDIRAGKLPAHFGPITFVFTGSGDASKVRTLAFIFKPRGNKFCIQEASSPEKVPTHFCKGVMPLSLDSYENIVPILMINFRVPRFN